MVLSTTSTKNIMNNFMPVWLFHWNRLIPWKTELIRTWPQKNENRWISNLSRKLNSFSKSFPQRKLLTLMVSLINLPNIYERSNNLTQHLWKNWKRGDISYLILVQGYYNKRNGQLISLINIETKIISKSVASWMKYNHNLVGFISGMQG